MSSVVVITSERGIQVRVFETESLARAFCTLAELTDDTVTFSVHCNVTVMDADDTREELAHKVG